MTNGSWHVRGEYFEACSCDYMCPCVYTNMTARPTQGYCGVTLIFHVNHGHSGDVSLDGLNFAVLGYAPGIMVEGNWTVGLIIDERASEAQANALAGIASGQAGGPMANLGPLLGNFTGIERRPIEFIKNGMTFSASIPDMVDQAIEGSPSPVAEGEPMYLDNVAYPVNSRLGLATASQAHTHGLGIDWDATSGKTNGYFAPFDWSA
jgi:hypothetical protein